MKTNHAHLQRKKNQWPLLLAAAASLAAVHLTPARAAIDILHSFTGSTSDGNHPFTSLTVSGSTLYGTTDEGGTANGGAAFSMNADGSGFNVLHSFENAPGNGGVPRSSLTLDGTTLYGTTIFSGGGNSGAVYRMNTDGSGFSLLHTFAGSQVYSPLTLSGATLYGMTRGSGSFNVGTVFSLNTDGSGFTPLHTFSNSTDNGRRPDGGLTLSGSTLYGMTEVGGVGNGGTIFSMNTDGSGFGLLHSFTGGAGDGLFAPGSLTLAGSKLYGMTTNGGSSDSGTLFSINTDGTGFSLLHSFTGGANDGADSEGSLTLLGSKLYGMTGAGGSSNNGTLFSINTDGTGFDLLESFGGAPADGADPVWGALTPSDDGSTLYGMTLLGGTADRGVVFAESIAAVPEPGTALFGVALVGIAAVRRRRATAV